MYSLFSSTVESLYEAVGKDWTNPQLDHTPRSLSQKLRLLADAEEVNQLHVELAFLARKTRAWFGTK